MSKFELKIDHHPARKKSPETHEQTDEPLLPFDRSIKVNGKLVGYINVEKPGRTLTFCVTLPDHERKQIEAEVSKRIANHIGKTELPTEDFLNEDAPALKSSMPPASFPDDEDDEEID